MVEYFTCLWLWFIDNTIRSKTSNFSLDYFNQQWNQVWILWLFPYVLYICSLLSVSGLSVPTACELCLCLMCEFVPDSDVCVCLKFVILSLMKGFWTSQKQTNETKQNKKSSMGNGWEILYRNLIIVLPGKRLFDWPTWPRIQFKSVNRCCQHIPTCCFQHSWDTSPWYTMLCWYPWKACPVLNRKRGVDWRAGGRWRKEIWGGRGYNIN